MSKFLCKTDLHNRCLPKKLHTKKNSAATGYAVLGETSQEMCLLRKFSPYCAVFATRGMVRVSILLLRATVRTTVSPTFLLAR